MPLLARSLSAASILAVAATLLAGCGAGEAGETAVDDRDAGPTDSDGGAPAVGATRRFAPGVLLVHSSYTLPPVRVCLSANQLRAEPSDGAMAAGNLPGLDVSTAAFVPAKALQGAADELVAYDAFEVATLEAAGKKSCADLAASARAVYRAPFLSPYGEAATYTAPQEGLTVVTLAGCPTLDALDGARGLCGSPALPVRATPSARDRPNFHGILTTLAGTAGYAELFNAAAAGTYVTKAGTAETSPATVSFGVPPQSQELGGALAVGQSAPLIGPNELFSETLTLTATFPRAAASAASAEPGYEVPDALVTATAATARLYVDRTTPRETFWGDRRIPVFVLVGAAEQREQGPKGPIVVRPKETRALQVTVASIPLASPRPE